MAKAAKAFLFGLLLLPSLPLLGASLQQHYLGIYLEINDAQHLEGAKDYLGAMVCYETAERILNRIHVRFPEWESALVTKRIQDCHDKAASLLPLAAKQLAALNNEWSYDASHANPGQFPSIERAQAKATFFKILEASHPEHGKHAFDAKISAAEKEADALSDQHLSDSTVRGTAYP